MSNTTKTPQAPTNRRARTALAALCLTAVAASTLAGCSGGSDDESTIRVTGFSVLESANDNVFSAFQDTDAGTGVDFKPAYGASGEMSRGVEAGQAADEVHLSLEPDMQRLVDAGIVADDWKDNDTGGICTDSIVVMVVQPGNPKNISTWADLVKPGVSVVTPNPASSGSAKWNLLAAYGSVLAAGGSEDDAKAYLSDLFGNISSLPDSGRDATTAFEKSNGDVDVLLSYENEAILARQNGKDFDYVVPESSLLIQNPCAVTEDAPDVANDFLDFQKSEAGQEIYAATGFRPVVDLPDLNVEGANDPADPFPTPATLQTIDDDFGGWATANGTFFGDGTGDNPLGIVTEIQQSSGS